MKPIQKLAEIKKTSATRNPSSKTKNPVQRTSPYGLVSAVHRSKNKGQVSEEISLKPIMVTFVPLSNSEVALKPDYPI